MTKKFGEADFDLSKYANHPDVPYEEKLPLRGCEEDPQALIEIFVKAKILENPDQQKIGYRGMSIIEEKENDADPKEEFEKNEKIYLKKIELKEEELA